MIEPIGPEAYLAIANVTLGALHNYRDKRQFEQQQKLAKIDSEISTWRTGSSAISGGSLEDLLVREGLEVDEDGYVTWNMENSTLPQNRSKASKCCDLGFIISLNSMLSAMSNAGTPASGYVSKRFAISNTVGLLAFTTMYLVGLALGHLILSPLTSNFGRKKLYIASAFLFSVFNIPIAATPHIAAVIVCRLITGFVSAIPQVTVSSSINDLFEPESEGRNWALFVSSLTTNLGITVGPVFGIYIAQGLNWCWIFNLAAITTSALSLLLFKIHESHPSHLLDTKLTQLKSTNPDLVLHTKPRPPTPGFHAFIRPLILLITEPLIFLTSLTSAFSFALLYLLPVALPPINFTPQTSLLLFLFTLPGLFVSILPRLYDRHINRRHQNTTTTTTTNPRPQTPETKLLTSTLAATLLATSLWWFACTIPPHKSTLPWAASATPLLALGYAVSEIDVTLSRYLRDTYTFHSPSALTSISILRALLAGFFPLFTPTLYDSLNPTISISTSLLASLATILSPIPLILILYGKRLRARSRFASGSFSAEHQATIKAEKEKVKEEKKSRGEEQKKRNEEEKRRKREEESREGNRAYVDASSGMGWELERGVAWWGIW